MNKNLKIVLGAFLGLALIAGTAMAIPDRVYSTTAQLIWGSVPDGYFVKRSGSRLVGVAGAGSLIETSGPTTLTLGAVADGSALKRSGSTVVGFTPAGQLGGTFASTTVLGIRETSGPTSLTNGAIADGSLLIRSGTSLIGTAGATKLIETAGPTTLSMGAVADGQTLQRSGSTVIGVDRLGTAGLTTLTYDGTTTLDFSPLTPTIKYEALTGDVTISSSNLAAGRSILYIVATDGSNRTLTYPAGWHIVGAGGPVVGSNSEALLQIYSTTGADSGVYVIYHEN